MEIFLGVLIIIFIFCLVIYWYFKLLYQGVKKIFPEGNKGILKIILKSLSAVLYVIILTLLLALIILIFILLIGQGGPVLFVMAIWVLIFGLVFLAAAIGIVIAFLYFCLDIFAGIYEWLALKFNWKI